MLVCPAYHWSHCLCQVCITPCVMFLALHYLPCMPRPSACMSSSDHIRTAASSGFGRKKVPCFPSTILVPPPLSLVKSAQIIMACLQELQLETSQFLMQQIIQGIEQQTLDCDGGKAQGNQSKAKGQTNQAQHADQQTNQGADGSGASSSPGPSCCMNEPSSSPGPAPELAADPHSSTSNKVKDQKASTGNKGSRRSASWKTQCAHCGAAAAAGAKFKLCSGCKGSGQVGGCVGLLILPSTVQTVRVYATPALLWVGFLLWGLRGEEVHHALPHPSLKHHQAHALPSVCDILTA